MFSLYDRVPKYLLEKSTLVSTVVFAAFFSLVFLLLSVPFSHNAWFKLGGSQAFGFTVIFFLIALCVVIVSKRLMYLVKDRGLTFLMLYCWDFAEILVISLLYAFFTVEGCELGVLSLQIDSFDSLLGSAILYSTTSLGVPYALSTMYHALKEKDNTIRLLNLGETVGDFSPSTREEKRITLFDTGGTLKFSTNQDNLFFIEADDNYIQVWYADSGGEIRQYMLRCRLKTVEDSFSDSDLVRCHRKHIVNIGKVTALTSTDKGYVLTLDIPGTDPIPVSKTYEQAVLARFNSRQ